LLAGSTHEPEEKLLLQTFLKLKAAFPKLCLIVVPRHPHRFEEAEHILKSGGLKVKCLSDNEQSKPSQEQMDCLLINAMGHLKACYSICDIAFVGGSFANKGGHNALEAALYSKPVIMGPSIFNNPKICEYLEARGALYIANDKIQLYEQCLLWLKNPSLAKDEGSKGAMVLQENAGAVDLTLGVIRRLN
jgi:3-deoxy-D-manno-octulosonic-acid transferase